MDELKKMNDYMRQIGLKRNEQMRQFQEMEEDDELKNIDFVEDHAFDNLEYEKTILVTNKELTTQLFFYIDPESRYIFYDVANSEYNGIPDSYKCAQYNFDDDEEVCLVHIGKWEGNKIPISDEYDINSKVGNALFNLYADYDRYIIKMNELKKKTIFSLSDVIDDLPDLTDREIMGLDRIYGEGLSDKLREYYDPEYIFQDENGNIVHVGDVAEELRGIRDAILQTKQCYKYSGSPMITLAEQSGTAPVEIPKSSVEPPPKISIAPPPPPVVVIPPPPGPPPPGPPPPPPPANINISINQEPPKKEESEIQKIRRLYGNSDLTQITGKEIEDIQRVDSQLFRKLQTDTYKKYKDNQQARNDLNATSNRGWTLSNRPEISEAVKKQESLSKGEKPAGQQPSVDLIKEAIRKREERIAAAAAAAAAAQGSGLYRRHYHRRM